jgi:hypothetical protein
MTFLRLVRAMGAPKVSDWHFTPILAQLSAQQNGI